MNSQKEHASSGGKSRMTEAEESIKLIRRPEDIPSGADWIEAREHPHLTKVHISLHRECRDLAAGKAEFETTELIRQLSNPENRFYTQMCQSQETRSGWGFAIYRKERLTRSEAGAFAATTSNTRMEIEAVMRTGKQ